MTQLSLRKTLDNDEFIKVVTKGGATYEIHEVELVDKTIDDIFKEIVNLKQNDSYYIDELTFIDTAQIIYMLKDKRKYMKEEVQQNP